MVEPMYPPFQRRIVRWGGAAAISGGVYALLIATIYAVARVGARGGLWMFGSLDVLLFPAPALFTLSLVTFKFRYGEHVTRIGRQALAVAIFGMALKAIGTFGAAWLGFARSGNYFQGLYVAQAVLWVVLGVLLWFERSAQARPGG